MPERPICSTAAAVRAGSAPAKTVLLVLASHANPQTGECWPKLETIVYETELGRSTVYRAIESLIALGHVRRDERGVFTVTPQDVPERDTASHSGTERPGAGQPASRSGTPVSRSGTESSRSGIPLKEEDPGRSREDPRASTSRAIPRRNDDTEAEAEVRPGMAQAADRRSDDGVRRLPHGNARPGGEGNSRGSGPVESRDPDRGRLESGATRDQNDRGGVEPGGGAEPVNALVAWRTAIEAKYPGDLVTISHAEAVQLDRLGKHYGLEELTARIERYMGSDRGGVNQGHHPLRFFVTDVNEYGPPTEAPKAKAKRVGPWAVPSATLAEDVYDDGEPEPDPQPVECAGCRMDLRGQVTWGERCPRCNSQSFMTEETEE